MYPDFKELLSTLNAHNVKYLIVGGYAVGFHAQPRATKDLDIFIRADIQNAKAVYDALAHFGAPLQSVSPGDLLDPNGFFRIGHAPVMIEILPKIEGVEFDDAWQKRIEIVIDAQRGLSAFMIVPRGSDNRKAGRWATPGFGRCRCHPEGASSPDALERARKYPRARALGTRFSTSYKR